MDISILKSIISALLLYVIPIDNQVVKIQISMLGSTFICDYLFKKIYELYKRTMFKYIIIYKQHNDDSINPIYHTLKNILIERKLIPCVIDYIDDDISLELHNDYTSTKINLDLK